MFCFVFLVEEALIFAISDTWWFSACLKELPYSAVLSKNGNTCKYQTYHPIWGQSTPMVEGCMDIMFDMVDTAFSYIDEHRSSANFFKNLPYCILLYGAAYRPNTLAYSNLLYYLFRLLTIWVHNKLVSFGVHQCMQGRDSGGVHLVHAPLFFAERRRNCKVRRACCLSVRRLTPSLQEVNEKKIERGSDSATDTDVCALSCTSLVRYYIW